MTSCEPTRCSAYSEDLRWRIVWQTEALRYTSDQVAKELTRMRVALHYCLVQEPCKPLYPLSKNRDENPRMRALLMELNGTSIKWS